MHPDDAKTVARALSRLHEIAAQSAKNGYYSLELEARLAAGEIAMRAGQSKAGREQLALVERDASANGFGLIAQRSAIARHDTLAQQH
jgi:hypothetical protein